MTQHRFNLEEIAGAIGDYGTLIPIILGVAIVTDISLAPVLFIFGLAYVFTGVYYRLPMPVEPMKAIGALAISGVLTVDEIKAAGILTGLIFMIVGITGGMTYIKKMVPPSIIRGIQLGLAFMLLRTAIEFIGADMLLGLVSLCIVALFTLSSLPDISALLIFSLGMACGIYSSGMPPITHLAWTPLNLPSLSSFWSGFIHGSLPQIPLTVGNAILATSLLISDLLNKHVSEKKLAVSNGLMCFLSSLAGGFPMCHGAGGLAAQYRFGARTGGSNIISGILLLLVALFLASPQLLSLFPLGVLGALLFFSALQLLKSVRQTDRRIFTIATGTLAFLLNMPVAFVAMLTIYWIVEKTPGLRSKLPS